MRNKIRSKIRRNKSRVLAKKVLGLLLAAAGAIIIIHTVPIAVWYGIGGLLIAVLLIYLFI